MQEIALGGLGPGRQRPLRQNAQQFKETGAATTPRHPELKAGNRLVREWQGQTYEVLVLDGGFSWQNTHHRSLCALARKITGTAWSGPLFFGFEPHRSASLLASITGATRRSYGNQQCGGLRRAESVARSTLA